MVHVHAKTAERRRVMVNIRVVIIVPDLAPGAVRMVRAVEHVIRNILIIHLHKMILIQNKNQTPKRHHQLFRAQQHIVQVRSRSPSRKSDIAHVRAV